MLTGYVIPQPTAQVITEVLTTHDDRDETVRGTAAAAA